MMGRPRVNLKAYRIIAKPYYGVLWQGEFWRFEDWERLEHRRDWMRKYMAERRKAAA